METNFNGKPSRVLPKRPFYSIVVACHESDKTIENLIKSIIAQEMNDEIELILSDDCSEDLTYLDIAHQYDDILSIKYVKTDYNFGPGNTREKGVSVAEGEWLGISDHDDEYIPGTLKQIQKLIRESGEERFVIANFYERDPETGNILGEMVQTTNWNHAKFYNLDNLWRKFDIHFKKDLRTHEDIYISSTINWIMTENQFGHLAADVFCYYWNNRPTTISREKYGDYPFLEVFMGDYVESTAGLYLEKFKENKMSPDNAFWNCIDVLLYTYFFTSAFMFQRPERFKQENISVATKLLTDIKESFNVTNKYIVQYVSQDDAEMFYSVMSGAIMSCGQHIPKYSFPDWLDWIHKDLDRTKMTDLIRKDNQFNDRDHTVIQDYINTPEFADMINQIQEQLSQQGEDGKGKIIEINPKTGDHKILDMPTGKPMIQNTPK